MKHVADLTPVEMRPECFGFDTGHLQEVLHDALEAAVSRLDLHCVWVIRPQAAQGCADDGNGCLQLM